MEYPSPGSLSPSKRARALSEIEQRPAKKLKQSYHRHHSTIHKLQKQPAGEPAILQERDLDKLLIDAIKSICEEVQSKEGLENFDIGSLALEAFRNATEEFILNICSAVRTHMRAARRSVPIATDFQSAVTFLNVPLDSSQLLPYGTNPTINPTLLPTPPPDDPFHNSTPLPADILGPDLVAQKTPILHTVHSTFAALQAYISRHCSIPIARNRCQTNPRACHVRRQTRRRSTAEADQRQHTLNIYI